MIVVNRPADLQQWIGQKIGVSEWLVIDQRRIDDFASVTGDDAWIHVDVERARREGPGGNTIAHGFLILSLIPFLARSIFTIAQCSRGINYGSNRVRFTAPVQVGERVRLHQTIKEADPVQGGTRVTSECMIEIDGRERPALVAEILMIAYDA